MSSPVYCVRPTDDLAHARKEMVARGVTKLVVIEDEKPVGVLTTTDLLGSGTDLDRTPERRSHMTLGSVEDVMTRRVYTTEPAASAAAVAREIARREISTAPVVNDDGSLAGILTAADLLETIRDRLESTTTVQDVMVKDVPFVHRHDSAAKVAAALLGSKARAAVVTDSESDRSMVGVVTAESVIFGEAFESRPSASRFQGEKRVKETRKREVAGRADARHVDEVWGAAEDLMVTDVPTARPEASVKAAANIFIHEPGTHVLPVLEGQAVVGVITKRDLVKAYARVAA